jgi:predicted ester cyclase
MNIPGQCELAARQCVETYNQGTTEWVDTYYAEEAEWMELPSVFTPRSQHGGIDVLRKKAARDLAAFPDRRMEILNLVAQGDQVVLELDWRGTAAVALGDHPVGTPVRLRVASFFSYANGKIVRQIDYCAPAQTGG